MAQLPVAPGYRTPVGRVRGYDSPNYIVTWITGTETTEIYAVPTTAVRPLGVLSTAVLAEVDQTHNPPTPPD